MLYYLFLAHKDFAHFYPKTELDGKKTLLFGFILTVKTKKRS